MSIMARNRRIRTKCPYCKSVSEITSVTFLAINDRGGIIVECMQGHRYAVSVKNPQEASVSNGRIVYRWDDENPPSREDTVNETGVDIDNDVESLWIVPGATESPLTYPCNTISIFQCPQCDAPLDDPLYGMLASKYEGIGLAYANAFNCYLSGGYGFKSTVVKLDCACSCGWQSKATLFRPFRGNESALPPNHTEFLLADIRDAKLGLLDGIFSKDDCLLILRKFLLRWQFICERTLIAAPYIGHPYMDKQVIVDLWDNVFDAVLPDRTVLIIKGAMVTAYKKALKEVGLDPAVMEKFDLLNAMAAQAHKKQDFHAKFYAGLSGNNVECLSGSFNIVEGKSFENLRFSPYEIAEFQTQYLRPMGIEIPLGGEVRREVLLIDASDDDCAAMAHIMTSFGIDAVRSLYEDRGLGSS